ncbi:MAG: hypothetical protein Q7K57_37225 [Burkholderiaceae bacterium]|nr:hypothetical protein [Burkholderiaceae bacterium]
MEKEKSAFRAETIQLMLSELFAIVGGQGVRYGLGRLERNMVINESRDVRSFIVTRACFCAAPMTRSVSQSPKRARSATAVGRRSIETWLAIVPPTRLSA